MQVPLRNKHERSQTVKDDESFHWYRDFFKKFFDIFFCSIGVIILAIPMGLIAIVIKLDSPREMVIFRQKRVGKDNKPFQILKFRTMKSSAPHQVATEDFEHPDKYITFVGKFLRKSSLDELPQIFNVLKGDMSVIGPRPLIPKEKEVLSWCDQYKANTVLPGITGLAQIHGRDKLTGKKKAQWDGRYARTLSIWLDLKIVVKTIYAVIYQRGIKEGK